MSCKCVLPLHPMSSQDPGHLPPTSPSERDALGTHLLAGMGPRALS